MSTSNSAMVHCIHEKDRVSMILIHLFYIGIFFAIGINAILAFQAAGFKCLHLGVLPNLFRLILSGTAFQQGFQQKLFRGAWATIIANDSHRASIFWEGDVVPSVVFI